MTEWLIGAKTDVSNIDIQPSKYSWSPLNGQKKSSHKKSNFSQSFTFFHLLRQATCFTDR